MENNVFIYWTGKEYSLIKVLRKIIYLHSEGGKHYSVIMITPDTVHQYIRNVPDGFFKLKPAHQADIVRVCVLRERGGIWLDSDTVVMDDLSLLFDTIRKKDGFLLTDRGGLINGIIGSKPYTPLMNMWYRTIMDTLCVRKGVIQWTEIGSTILERLYKNDTSLFSSYKIFDGPATMHPVHWSDSVREFITSDYDNYKTIERAEQPLVILFNSVYKHLDSYSEDQIVGGRFPLSYFIRKSVITSSVFV